MARVFPIVTEKKIQKIDLDLQRLLSQTSPPCDDKADIFNVYKFKEKGFLISNAKFMIKYSTQWCSRNSMV